MPYLSINLKPSYLKHRFDWLLDLQRLLDRSADEIDAGSAEELTETAEGRNHALGAI